MMRQLAAPNPNKTGDERLLETRCANMEPTGDAAASYLPPDM